MQLHKRINGQVLNGDAVVTVNFDQDAAAVLDADNRLIAYARKGWQEVTNVCDIAWDWVRKDFRFIVKKRG
jgi:hypothetical protein